MYRIIVPALCALLAGTTASAKDLKILTGAGMSMPVRQLAAAYGARTGARVTVTADTAGGEQKRMEAGETFDLVIGTTTVLDRLTQEGKVAAVHADLAQMVAGISARKGAPAPALADGAQLKTSLLSAKSIAYVDPAKGGITGVFFLSQADRLGIGNAVRAKAVLRPNGAGVADAVARGEADYGVTLISEMLPNRGVTVWPLPRDVQMTTIYAAALSAHPENEADARALLEELRGPPGHDAARQAGLLPVSQ